jgi:hypothetical protein
LVLFYQVKMERCTSPQQEIYLLKDRLKDL